MAPEAFRSAPRGLQDAKTLQNDSRDHLDAKTIPQRYSDNCLHVSGKATGAHAPIRSNGTKLMKMNQTYLNLIKLKFSGPLAQGGLRSRITWCWLLFLPGIFDSGAPQGRWPAKDACPTSGPPPVYLPPISLGPPGSDLKRSKTAPRAIFNHLGAICSGGPKMNPNLIDLGVRKSDPGTSKINELY